MYLLCTINSQTLINYNQVQVFHKQQLHTNVNFSTINDEKIVFCEWRDILYYFVSGTVERMFKQWSKSLKLRLQKTIKMF